MLIVKPSEFSHINSLAVRALDRNEYHWTPLDTLKFGDIIPCVDSSFIRFRPPPLSEWHYYITSRRLTADELPEHARLEWSAESMHWLLDVHFSEDFCRIEDDDVQQVLNMVRKIALNCIKTYKQKSNSKRPGSKIMLDCLLEPAFLLPIIGAVEN